MGDLPASSQEKKKTTVTKTNNPPIMTPVSPFLLLITPVSFISIVPLFKTLYANNQNPNPETSSLFFSATHTSIHTIYSLLQNNTIQVYCL